MARLSDVIEKMIKDMIEANGGRVELTRGELADRVNCVPSQITYVLSTRFTSGQGYIVESRRGGGGWIRIQRIQAGDGPKGYVMHVLNTVGDHLTQHQASIYLGNFVDYDILPKATAQLIQVALSDQTLGRIPPQARDYVRMDLMKNLLLKAVLGLGPNSRQPLQSSHALMPLTDDWMEMMATAASFDRCLWPREDDDADE